MDDVSAWESRYGRIPEGCFVALRTDWSKRWPNQTAMLNRDPQWDIALSGLEHGGAALPL